jgi:hypothetical protein
MKKFEFTAESITVYDTVIEAETEEEAYKIYDEMISDDFNVFSSEWRTINVSEV